MENEKKNFPQKENTLFLEDGDKIVITTTDNLSSKIVIENIKGIIAIKPN